jgi:hypothetical protein
LTSHRSSRDSERGEHRRLWFGVPMRLVRRVSGGVTGNAQLTALTAVALLVLFAVEGVTLLRMGTLLSVHAFVGVVLVPVAGLKVASTAWRMLRYYLGDPAYVRHGPPHPLLRFVVGPGVVVSTFAVLGTGIALLALGRTQGPIVLLHQASFVVWLGAVGVHVLTRLPRLADALRRRVPGSALRVAILACTLAAGFAVATLTLPAADRLQDGVTARIGTDSR